MTDSETIVNNEHGYTLGNGTCKPTEEGYCPNCGAKVVGE